MSPECNEFFVGFQKGGINVFKAETTTQKPSRWLSFEEGPLNSMELAFYQRPKNYFTLVVKFNRDKDIREFEQEEEKNLLNESGIISRDHTEVVIIKGSHFEETVRLEHLMPDEDKNQCFLVASGVFQLYEKYFTLNQLKFTNPKEKEQILGLDIGEHLKAKNQNVALYPGFLLLVMTKNLKLLYMNLDSLLMMGDSGDTEEGKKYSPMTVYDKIYG